MEFLKTWNQNAFADLDISTHVLDLQGWVNRGFNECVGTVVDKLRVKKDVVVIEIGSWKGRSSNMIAVALKNGGVDCKHLICVDTWLGSPEHFLDTNYVGMLPRLNGYAQLYYTFVKNVKSCKNHDIITPLPLPSLQAAYTLERIKIQADAIYVDAAHEYDAVLADMNAFYGLLKPGGVFWGDDYSNTWPGVQRAVNEFANTRSLELVIHGHNWLMLKPESA